MTTNLSHEYSRIFLKILFIWCRLNLPRIRPLKRKQNLIEKIEIMNRWKKLFPKLIQGFKWRLYFYSEAPVNIIVDCTNIWETGIHRKMIIEMLKVVDEKSRTWFEAKQ